MNLNNDFEASIEVQELLDSFDHWHDTYYEGIVSRDNAKVIWECCVLSLHIKRLEESCDEDKHSA